LESQKNEVLQEAIRQPYMNREEQILAAIKEFVRVHGYPPTVREICLQVGLNSSSTVHGYLCRLKEKGKLTYEPTKPRTLRVLEK